MRAKSVEEVPPRTSRESAGLLAPIAPASRRLGGVDRSRAAPGRAPSGGGPARRTGKRMEVEACGGSARKLSRIAALGRRLTGSANPLFAPLAVPARKSCGGRLWAARCGGSSLVAHRRTVRLCRQAYVAQRSASRLAESATQCGRLNIELGQVQVHGLVPLAADANCCSAILAAWLTGFSRWQPPSRPACAEPPSGL